MSDVHPNNARPLSTVAEAWAYVAERALCHAPIGAVGLELEGHLVDRRDLARRVSWAEITRLRDGVPDLPGGSALTVEPGGQLELSTPPARDLSGAVASLRADEAVLQRHLRADGYGLAFVGVDPLRRAEIVNPSPRYAVMARYFDQVGCGPAGLVIMTSSAGLQLNVEAGPPSQWAERLARLDRLAPVLAAMSACSPMAAGGAGGATSMRQQAWLAIDPTRTSSVGWGSDPAAAWADYALSASLMLIRSSPGGGAEERTKHAHGAFVSAPRAFSFADWIASPERIGRAPSIVDLDYHLTTLFPPVRPRGFLELRFLDAVPSRWWPGLVALAGTLLDHPVAAASAQELLTDLRPEWTRVVESGLRDPHLRSVVHECAALAVRHAPPDLRSEAAAYAELLAAGRTPGDLLQAAARGDGRRLLQAALGA